MKPARRLLSPALLALLFGLLCVGPADARDFLRREALVDVPGGRVWTLTVNPEAPGTPLLVVHGGPGATHHYLSNLAALADERPVVFYDQLGSGASDRPGDPSLWTVDRAVAELSAVREALGLDRVHLLGQSWGGALVVSCVLATEGPGVESLVLSAPLLSTPRWVADQKAWLARLPREMRQAVERAEASEDFDDPDYLAAMDAFYRRHLCRLDPWPQSLMRTFEGLNPDIYQHMWGPSEFTAAGTLMDLDLTPRLGEISVPTLFTCGEFDEAPPASMRFFAARVPGAGVAVLPDASHVHHLEKPEAFLNLVRYFLVKADQASRP